VHKARAVNKLLGMDKVDHYLAKRREHKAGAGVDGHGGGVHGHEDGQRHAAASHGGHDGSGHGHAGDKWVMGGVPSPSPLIPYSAQA
jgi:hypothetical protein